jgi:hypothetical protein
MSRRARTIILLAIAIVAIMAIVYLIFRYVPLSTLRDLAIIFIALLNIVLLVLLIAIAFGIWRLVAMFRDQLPPVIGSARRTLTSVEGTADFVTTGVAHPLIRATSLVYAATRFVEVLFARRGARGG